MLCPINGRDRSKSVAPGSCKDESLGMRDAYAVKILSGHLPVSSTLLKNAARSLKRPGNHIARAERAEGRQLSKLAALVGPKCSKNAAG